ncbi:MAG: hypothetical protein LBP63_01225 [Prevotellaceae bacterium]|jgi:hypothetical protein|nr:hypothetical protein [Prevotellaceae bacterium]
MKEQSNDPPIITKAIVGIKEINKYLVPYLNGSETIPDNHRLIFKFSPDLEAIDELFYAYLLLLKQSLAAKNETIDIGLAFHDNSYYRTIQNDGEEENEEDAENREFNKKHEKAQKSLQIARQHLAFLNVYFPNTFFIIRSEYNDKQEFPNPDDLILSKGFFPHILVNENLKYFKRLDVDFRKLTDTDLYIKYAQETFDILNNLNHKNISTALKKYNFVRKSPIEYYFLYLFISRYAETEYGKNALKFDDTLSYIFQKVENIYTGLNELAKNIKEHSGYDGKQGIGVISARVFSKEKTETLKIFGQNFTNWFEKQKDEYFLDINVIDAGQTGITQHYINSIKTDNDRYSESYDEAVRTNKENEKTVYKGLSEAANKDIKILTDSALPYLFNYSNVQLNHQKYRVNARIGLLFFSHRICTLENGIVKVVSKSKIPNKYEAYCFYIGNDKTFQSEQLNENDLFVKFGTNYNFIIHVSAKEIKVSSASDKNYEQGMPTSLLNKLRYKDLCYYNINDNIKNKEIAKQDSRATIVTWSNDVIAFYHQCIKETDTNGNDKPDTNSNDKIVVVNAADYENIFTESDWVRFLIGTQFSTNVEKPERVPLIVYNMNKDIYKKIKDICRIYEKAFEGITSTEEKDKNIVFGFWMPDSAILFYIKHTYTFNNDSYQNRELSLWFSSVLAGNTYEKYLAINRKISHYQHNLYRITNIDPPITDAELDKQNISSTNNSPLFEDDKLLNFELLIKDKETNLTLFEQSVRNLLNLDIRTLPDSINDITDNESKFFYEFKGYKISDSHFSLGAKIHISDYYYAKRMFYNSFYANRFAFLIAKYLLDTGTTDTGTTDAVFEKCTIKTADAGGKKQDEQVKDVTLIGYSRYSELLVSNVRRLLELQDKTLSINHDVILEDGNALKNPDDIKDNVIIIIPIASTFSTSEKIKKAIDKIRSNLGKSPVNIVNKKVINVLCVADKETFEEKQYTYTNEDIKRLEKKKDSAEYQKYIEYTKGNRFSLLYPPFGWHTHDKDNNVIELTNGQKQKYFINLDTQWNLIYKCKLCFPGNLPDEKCLLETGANAVTPESIFSFPVTDIADNKNDFKQYFHTEEKDKIKSFILEKHVCRDNKHYKHYIKADKFLERNKTKIEEWLKDPKKFENIKAKIDTHKIIIITPSRTANSGFVNMVNQHIFSETATVLQYSDMDDILQNFIRFNASFFRKNSFVIFVDDVLHTATSLHNINNYIKNIPSEKDEDSKLKDEDSKQKTVDCCIVLFNRLGFFDKKDVENNLSKAVDEGEKILAYASINLPPVHLPGYEFPDVKTGKLFEILAKTSVTDTMKLYFNEEKDKIKPFDFDKDLRYPQGEWDDVFHFLVFRALYGFFIGKLNNKGLFDHKNRENIKRFTEKNNNDPKNNNSAKDTLFTALKKHVEEYTNVKEFIKDAKDEINTDYSEEIENKITYILATPPFVYYKDIREFAFYLVLKKLREFVSEIAATTDFTSYHTRKSSDGKYATPHCKYESFKHFLHLAANLKINYIFSIEMLNAIEIMLNTWNDKIKRTEVEKIKVQVTQEKETSNKKTLFDYSEPQYEYKNKEIKDDYAIGFITYYVAIIEQLVKTDEAKAIKLIENIYKYINNIRIKLTKNDTEVFDKAKHLTLRNNFTNKFVELLRNLVLENTFIFKTYIEEFEKSEEFISNKNSFTFDNYEKARKNIETYYNDANQAARKEALTKMLWDYKNDSLDENLKTAFFKTVYLKELLNNDTDDNQNNDRKINEKINNILQCLSYILGINTDECKNGGAYFTVRYTDKNKPENDIQEEDLYTVEKYCVNDKDDEIDANLTADDTLVYQFYKGIKEKNRKKPESVIELKYINEEKGYVTVALEEYHGEKEIKVNEKWFETGDTFGKRYNNLLFMRITDIKENTAYHEMLGKYIDVFRTTEDKEKSKRTLLEKLAICKQNNNKLYKEILDLHVDLLRSTKKIKIKRLVKYLNEDLKHFHLSLNTEQKLVKKLKEAQTKEEIKDILLEYNRQSDYVSNPVAVIVFYKCRLDEKGCPCCGDCKTETGTKTDITKRFDPKRLRFLMLLRDDILAFCKHHFDNDSLRAFVEEENKKDISFSMEHGTDTYVKDMIYNYFKPITTKCQTKEDKKYYDTLFDFFVNKIELRQKYLKDNFKGNTKLKEFITLFEENYKYILSFKSGSFSGCTQSNQCIFHSIGSNTCDCNQDVLFSEILMKEIVFETIYNIRKYAAHPYHPQIYNRTTILNIKLELKSENNINYLILSNSPYSLAKDQSINKINRQIKTTKKRIKGLNLIYNCLYPIFKKNNIFVKENNEEKNFEVWIPISKK